MGQYCRCTDITQFARNFAFCRLAVRNSSTIATDYLRIGINIDNGLSPTRIIWKIQDVKVKGIEITHLTKKFGGLCAVDDLSVSIAAGKTTGLIGPNGSGKTTLMNLISGLYKQLSQVTFLSFKIFINFT